MTTDLNIGFPLENASYVLLSRPVGRDAIVLLQDFNRKLLQRPPAPELLEEQDGTTSEGKHS